MYRDTRYHLVSGSLIFNIYGHAQMMYRSRKRSATL